LEAGVAKGEKSHYDSMGNSTGRELVKQTGELGAPKGNLKTYTISVTTCRRKKEKEGGARSAPSEKILISRKRT